MCRCRYASHLLIQEDNEQVVKMESLRDGESVNGHADGSKPGKTKVRYDTTSPAARASVGFVWHRWLHRMPWHNTATSVPQTGMLCSALLNVDAYDHSRPLLARPSCRRVPSLRCAIGSSRRWRSTMKTRTCGCVAHEWLSQLAVCLDDCACLCQTSQAWGMTHCQAVKLFVGFHS